MKKLTAGIFTVLIGLCAANSADAAIASKAWVEQDFATKTALNATNEEVAKKANAADVYTKNDVYTKTESDGRFDAINAAQNALTTAQSYTDAQLKTLADQFGTSGGDGQEGTGLSGIVAGHTLQIGTLETKVGDKDVAVQISEALSAYTTEKDYLNKTEASTTYATIANLGLANQAIEGLGGRLTTAEGDITALENRMVNSLADGVDSKTVVPSIFYVESAIANSNTLTGASIEKNAEAIAAEEQRATAAEGAINTKIGAVAEGKDVVMMISEGDAATLASAKGYTDTELDKLETSLSGTSTNLTDLTTRVSTAEGKITGLETSLAEGGDTANAIKANADAIQGINDSDVMTSGIDAEKVAAIAANTAEIAKNAKAIADNAQAAADAAAANAASIATNSTNIATNSANIAANTKKFENYTETKDLSILATNNIPTECSNNTNKCVLTYGTTATGNIGFEWEVVERETDGE
ncbi:MAG: hypothetical protein IKB05_03305 [Alphaproteobacteria bacterium]|nr:hypothetical protein [Alphaproteobacteria bacterium]